jgi:hypothetical protein
MSPSQSQPDAPDTEELVAYLDGELSADECRRVERRLASDADYRRQLTELEQAWLVLEELPRPTVDDNFARTTIEMVAVEAERDVTARSATRSTDNRRRMLVGGVVGLGLAVLAFVAVRTLFPGPNGMLVNDLPVVAQLDVLTQVEDVDFLRGLTTLDFRSTDNGGIDAQDAATRLVSTASWQSPEDRRQWIEKRSAAEKAELAALLDRYAKLTPTARDRLRELARAIADAPDRAELERRLADYGAWIQRRTQGQQMELRQLSTAARLDRVKEMLNDNGRQQRWRLSPEDERALQEAVLEFVAERKASILRENPEAQRRLADRPTAMVALTIIQMEMRDDKGRQRLHDRLTARLSPAAQDYLEDLQGRERRWQLWRWTYEALQPKLGPEELEEFFTSKLTIDEREELLAMPLPEMEDRLRQMYMRSQIGLREGDWGGGFGRPGENGRGGPGLGRPPDWERGRGDRGPGGRRGGPGRDFDGERFERPPFPPGPGGGPPGGPPPEEPI